MEKRALIAVVLSLLILVVYQEWVGRQYTPPPPSQKDEKKTENVAAPLPKPQPTLQEAKPVAHAAQETVKEIRVETDYYIALFTNKGARLKSFTLKHYRTSVDAKSLPFEMISSTPGVPHPLGLQLQGPNPFNDEGLLYSVRGGDLRLTGDAKGTLIFQGQSPTEVTLTKEFTFTGSSYPIRLEVSVQGPEGSAVPALLVATDGNRKGPSQDAVFEGLLALVDNKIKREDVEEIKKGKELSGPVSWAGFGYTYFLFALLPESGAQQRLTARQIGPALIMDMAAQPEPKAGEKSRYTLFIGPKELNTLKAMEKGLERS
ncbi:MAG: membrane protein insertase YidC, partial [Deltaproteobacteria bacterium]|nr:membrane protein insertase YidC [Deltaproteobacteria bacterium]